MHSIFQNIDLERFYLSGKWPDLYINHPAGLFIGLEIFICSALCSGHREKNDGKPLRLKLNEEYSAFWRQICDLAKAGVNRPKDPNIFPAPSGSIAETIDVAVAEIKYLPSKKTVRLSQIRAMGALWAFDEGLGLLGEHGWSEIVARQFMAAAELAKEAGMIAIEEERMSTSSDGSPGCIEALIREAVSKQTQEASQARHRQNHAMMQEAWRLYDANPKWKSPHQAAKIITPQIQAFAEANSFTPLSVDRGQQTVGGWLRKRKK